MECRVRNGEIDPFPGEEVSGDEAKETDSDSEPPPVTPPRKHSVPTEGMCLQLLTCSLFCPVLHRVYFFLVAAILPAPASCSKHLVIGDESLMEKLKAASKMYYMLPYMMKVFFVLVLLPVYSFC